MGTQKSDTIKASPLQKIVMRKCATCGKEKPVSEMQTCMHNQMHNYVCDSKCMTKFYA